MDKDSWSTPPEIFNRLDEEFNFTLDAAASQENAKCDKFYTKKDNGLEKSWERESFYKPTLQPRKYSKVG